MRISEILNEAGSWPPNDFHLGSDQEQFISIINNKHHPYHEYLVRALTPYDPTHIYRGFRNAKHGVFIVDPTNAPDRQSANTSNYYTWWMDELSDKWGNFPKRSRSLICTTDRNKTEHFGLPHLIIPLQPTTLGICPDNDLWNSFGSIDPLKININLDDIMREANIEIPESADEFWQALSRVDALLNKNPEILNDVHLEHLVMIMKKTGAKNMTELFDEVYDPNKRGFTVAKWPCELPKNREVWFSGPAYAINIWTLDDIRKHFRNRK